MESKKLNLNSITAEKFNTTQLESIQGGGRRRDGDGATGKLTAGKNDTGFWIAGYAEGDIGQIAGGIVYDQYETKVKYGVFIAGVGAFGRIDGPFGTHITFGFNAGKKESKYSLTLPYVNFHKD